MIARVSAIFLLPVFEKSVIFNDFRDIWHSTSAGGSTVCSNAIVRNTTDDDSVTYWFLWKHRMARRRGLEFGVFDQSPPKTGSSARPYGPHRSIRFPLQNYNSQSIGSARRASPFVSFGAFAQKHTSLFERRKCTRRQFFAPRRPPRGLGHAALDSDHAECEGVSVSTPSPKNSQSLPGIELIYKMRNLTNFNRIEFN